MTRSREAINHDSAGFGLRGYRNSGIVSVVVIVGAAAVGWSFAEAYSGPLLRNALMGALVPVGFLMVFGFGYASDTLPKRLARFGSVRETHTTALVLIFFLVAVGTVALILAYLAVNEDELICLGFTCKVEVRTAGLNEPWRPFVLPHTMLGTSAMAGVGLLLAGSVMLIDFLLRPREYVYSKGFDWPRIGGRALDVVILLAITVGLYLIRAEVDRWLLVAMFVLLPFLYEVLPWVLPRFRRWRWLRTPGTSGSPDVARGKWWPWLQIAPTGKDADTVARWRFVVRALVTSFVFSFGVELALVSAAAPVSAGAWVVGAHLVFGLTMAAAMAHPRGQGLHDALLGTHVRRVDKTVGSEVEDSQQVLRLRPRELGHDAIRLASVDLLDRGSQVELVSGVLRRDSGPVMVMVDAPWGAGKTTFLRLCAAELKNDALVVEFNSWTQQYTRHPLSDLVSAISYRLQAKKEKQAKARTLEWMIESLTGVFGVTGDTSQPTGSWNRLHESVQRFRSELRQVAAEHGRILLIVDELDRCRPGYALATLETLYHLFSEEGVVVLVGVNRDALQTSIKSIYGFDADAYLRRFADLPVDLPAPTPDSLVRFLDSQLNTIGLADQLDRDSAGILRLVADIDGCSLRDLQQAVRLAALALAADPPDGHPKKVWERSIMAMIVLQTADRQTYRLFARREIDSLDALVTANSKLPPYPDVAGPKRPVRPEVYQFEAALLNIVSNADPIDTDHQDWFQRTYVDGHEKKRRSLDMSLPSRIGGTSRDAVHILDELARLRRKYPNPPGWRPLWVELIAERLDLIATG
jgi:hypothetical protein